MSDLTATHCGCGNNDNRFGCNNIIWLIILLAICGNNGNDCDCDCGNNGIFGNNGGCCDILFLILILSCCGNGCGF